MTLLTAPTPEERKAKADEVNRQKKQARDNDLRFVMSNEKGRRFIWSLLEEGGVFKSTFAIEPQLAAHNEGKRDMALRLLVHIQQDAPDKYLIMLKERLRGNNA